ncbi:MAG: PilN domain-containing protein [Actinomycetota bacterium]
MIRRVNLLPEKYAELRKQKRTVGYAALAGAVVLGLLIFYWFSLSSQISSANDDFAATQQVNAQIQQQVSALQHFAQLQTEVNTKQQALASVMTGDVDWSAVMSELAMVIPSDVWLDSMTASAGTTEGSSQVGTETADIPITNKPSFGRIAFTGSATSMTGVAKWLLGLGKVKDFAATFLNRADGGDSGDVIAFDSTVQLTEAAASQRFQGQAP